MPRTLGPAHSRRACARRLSIRTFASGVAFFSQFSTGRQVGWGADTSTNFPRACGSQRTNSVLSANRGRITVVAVRSFFRVPGLKPSMVPSRERTRGATRSMCEAPRRQPRQVPARSLRAVMPQLV
ncbi:MAG: hypothetical protein IPI38_06490 [Gemmatimonadetes bacterium]|nr:hypothetical protein [Gemmatimonadota bacterium]